MGNRKWAYDTGFIRSELKSCLDCSYAITNYLWVRTNLYGFEKYDSLEVIKDAENELNTRCLGPNERQCSR
jgi:hypothetical protein